jgi:hypothetical protein
VPTEIFQQDPNVFPSGADMFGRGPETGSQKMRIHDVHTNAPNGSQLDKAHGAEAAAGAANTKEGGRGAAGDRVQLSGLASRLAGLIGSEGQERAAGLDRLAAQVKSGAYRPDASAVSRSLIDESLAQGV